MQAVEKTNAQGVFPEALVAFGQTIAPFALAMERDNVGLLVSSGRQVHRVLCALDITSKVVEEAVALGCEMIVSHHPVIYRPLHSMCQTDVVYKLAQNNISALCLHTNLDTAQGGVNDVLAQVLGLVEVQPFGSGMGRIGRLGTPFTAEAFAAKCQNALGAPVRYTRSNAPIGKVAVLGGTGGDEAAAAFAAGADAFVTGEAGHHVGVAAAHTDKMLVTAGHFATEHPVVAELARLLQQEFPTITVHESKTDADPFCSL